MLQAQLAKIFNGSVTHLRHHLPMVAHALGGADGDVGLVQLVNVEVEKRAVALLRKFCKDRDLANLCARGEYVSTQIEDRFIAGDAGSLFLLFGHNEDGITTKVRVRPHTLRVMSVWWMIVGFRVSLVKLLSLMLCWMNQRLCCSIWRHMNGSFVMPRRRSRSINQ